MKNIRDFLSENFQFLEEKFSIYLNRCVFVMSVCLCILLYSQAPISPQAHINTP